MGYTAAGVGGLGDPPPPVTRLFCLNNLCSILGYSDRGWDRETLDRGVRRIFIKGGLRQRGYIKRRRNGRPIIIMRAKYERGGGGGGIPLAFGQTRSSGRPLRFTTYERS